MMQASVKNLTAGTKVRVKDPGPTPNWSNFEDDFQRTSTSVKKRLQDSFFKGDKKLVAEILFISSEDERERLRRDKRVKVALRSPGGSPIVITADATNLHAV